MARTVTPATAPRYVSAFVALDGVTHARASRTAYRYGEAPNGHATFSNSRPLRHLCSTMNERTAAGLIQSTRDEAGARRYRVKATGALYPSRVQALGVAVVHARRYPVEFGFHRKASGCVVTAATGTHTRDLAPRHDLANHSPTGLEWGYNGSGPLQLALALAASLVSPQRALAVHLELRRRFVAKLDNRTEQLFTVPAREVLDIIETIEREQAEQAEQAAA